jgi:valyl-tRNA synthetase
MVHPDDPRAPTLIGQCAYSALLEVEVPVIADPRVDPSKGSGLVMCCTFGDQTDVDWWREHQLPLRMIVGGDGRLTNLDQIGSVDWPCRNSAAAQQVRAALEGLNVRKARGAMVDLLQDAGLILDQQTVMQAIPCAERSGAPLEILVTEQWMVRLLDKKEQLIAAGRAMRWHPSFMQQRYEEWVNNLKWDWCISRQRYFGVPLPFWYSRRAGEEGKVLVPALEDLPVNPLTTPPRGYSLEEVEPETDVMDTWATSSVSPQINSWAVSPEMSLDYDRHRRLFPADLRPQAHEIIRTWTFYTVAKALLHENCAPFKDLAISGWCLANDQTKMSKSKGNVVTPNDVLGRYGVDVVRYWAAQGRLGRDTAYSEDVLKVGKRLTTKLWNASKLVYAHIGDFDRRFATAQQALDAGAIVNGIDRWCLSQLADTVRAASDHFAAYNYTDALAVTERFFWKTYCDNYLELAKGRLYGEIGTEQGRNSARTTLFFVHRTVLALFAPFLPYITEDLFASLYRSDFDAARSVHARGGWPDAASLGYDPRADQHGELAVDVLSAIRKMKSAHKTSIRAPLGPVTITWGQAVEEKPNNLSAIHDLLDDVAFAANCQGFMVAEQNDPTQTHDGEKGFALISAAFLSEPSDLIPSL